MYRKIIDLSNKIEKKTIDQRRDFHKYAESGWFEMRTSSIIAGKLADMGYKVITGPDVCEADAMMGLPTEHELKEHYQWAKDNGADERFLEPTKFGFTGVIGIMDCGEGPTVAMRFDIDALGVIESMDEEHFPYKHGFSSVNDGVMHACGHDGHASIGLGVAEILMNIRESLHGKVKLIFQPAEEGVRGARAIVKKGHLDDVDYLLASHISESDDEDDSDSDLITGSYGSLATSKFDIYFHGKSAHAGGSPEKGDNVMLSVATAILNLQAIPRHSDGITRINVGKVEAGTGRNVIPDQAKMEIEVRGETSEINDYVEEYALRIIKAAAQMHNSSYEIKRMGSAQSLNSDDDLALKIRDICNKNLIEIKLSDKLKSKNSGSEDVSYMMKKVQENGGQATFMRTLTTITDEAHSRTFNFDEEVLAKGIKIFSIITYDVLKDLKTTK
ncbi:MAG: amidohydrolase [Sedimentibacter sp.]